MASCRNCGPDARPIDDQPTYGPCVVCGGAEQLCDECGEPGASPCAKCVAERAAPAFVPCPGCCGTGIAHGGADCFECVAGEVSARVDSPPPRGEPDAQRWREGRRPGRAALCRSESGVAGGGGALEPHTGARSRSRSF